MPGAAQAQEGAAVGAAERRPALRVEHLSIKYGDVVAVHDATFAVDEGECVALVGPNGNGKSSIVMGIVGLAVRGGRVDLFGSEAPARNVNWTARHGLTLVPERRHLYPALTVLDNVVLGCYSWTRNLRKARTSAPYERALALFPELERHFRQRAGTLSGGQQQMVAIARGMAADPRLLAVDEPCLGLAEAVSKRVYQVLGEIHAEGRTLVIVEEDPRRALQLATRQVEVRNGVVV